MILQRVKILEMFYQSVVDSPPYFPLAKEATLKPETPNRFHKLVKADRLHHWIKTGQFEKGGGEGTLEKE